MPNIGQVSLHNKPTKSRFGPTSNEFQLKEYADGHSVYPSWCLVVSTIYLSELIITYMSYRYMRMA